MVIKNLKSILNNYFEELEHNYWTVIDENDNPYMVKLFPQISCSCKVIGKSKCVHVLAVMKANGMPITDGYILPKLSALTRLKRNDKLNVRKRRGHRINAQIEPVTSQPNVASNIDVNEDSFESEKEREDLNEKER